MKWDLRQRLGSFDVVMFNIAMMSIEKITHYCNYEIFILTLYKLIFSIFLDISGWCRKRKNLIYLSSLIIDNVLQKWHDLIDYRGRKLSIFSFSHHSSIMGLIFFELFVGTFFFGEFVYICCSTWKFIIIMMIERDRLLVMVLPLPIHNFIENSIENDNPIFGNWQWTPHNTQCFFRTKVCYEFDGPIRDSF